MDDIDNWKGNSPLPLLYAKTATGTTNTWLCWVEGPDVCVRWGLEEGQQQEARFRCVPKNVGRVNATTAEEQARFEAIAKWKKQCKKKYNQTRELSFLLKPMLALNFKDRVKRIVWPATMQPKYNGLRCLSYWSNGSVRLQSRGGDPYSVVHIANALSTFLPVHTTLDGELYTHGMSLERINSLVRKPQPESVLIEYHAYDATWPPDSSVPWSTRCVWLSAFLETHTDGPIKCVPTWTVHSPNDVQAHHDRLVAEGYEGGIVRLNEGTYRYGFRSPDLLKFKAFEDAEFPIVGYTVGKGKFLDMPVFTCKTKNGAPFEVVPRGTADKRRRMLIEAPALIGKQLTVRYRLDRRRKTLLRYRRRHS